MKNEKCDICEATDVNIIDLPFFRTDREGWGGYDHHFLCHKCLDDMPKKIAYDFVCPLGCRGLDKKNGFKIAKPKDTVGNEQFFCDKCINEKLGDK